MASIGQLAAGIAHEINTPIQFINSNITFLNNTFDELLESIRDYREKLDFADTDLSRIPKLAAKFLLNAKEFDFDYLKDEIPLALEQTAEGAQRVSRIVKAMNSFAYSGGTEIGPVDMVDLIHTTIEISRNAWEPVADLDVELIVPPLVVKGRSSELGQVLLNLIINAADAIAEFLQPENIQGKILIRTQRMKKWGEILVTDSGCGIDSSQLTRIFEPFFTTKDVGKGSGQGLAIAYNIITETHGGELLVDSDPGMRSTFTIRLPLENP
jgi:signal transduction histidine kinase